MKYELIAPCHFGLESVCKKEILELGCDISRVEDGKVFFTGDADAGILANLSLRTAERVLLLVGRFHAESWDELFEGTKNLPWENYLPWDARFWVAKAASVSSKLFSPSDSSFSTCFCTSGEKSVSIMAPSLFAAASMPS